MNENLKIISKCIKFSVLWSVVLIGLAIIVKLITNNSIQNILFFEGIFAIIIGLISSFEGSPSAFPIHPLNNINYQYIANVNLEILKKEKNSIKTEINPSISIFTIILTGIICISISALL